MSGTDDQALTDIDVGSDSELFNQALSDDTPETPVVTQEPQAEPQEGQPRDEHGRFASPQPQAEKPVETPPDAERQVDHRVPLSEFLSTREERNALRQERDAMRQQLEQFQRQARQPAPQQVERPDPLLDPEGYDNYLQQKLDERATAERRETSLLMAQHFYKDEFSDAYTAAQAAVRSGDRVLMARMQQSGNPGQTLIEWHREQRTMKEVGTDPNAWLEKKLEERMSDPAFQAKVIERARAGATPGGQAAPNVRLPPSLSRATNAAGAHMADPTENDTSDAALFEYATRQ